MPICWLTRPTRHRNRLQTASDLPRSSCCGPRVRTCSRSADCDCPELTPQRRPPCHQRVKAAAPPCPLSRLAVRTFDACQLALQRLRLRQSRLFNSLFAKNSEQPCEPSRGQLCGRRGHTAGWPSAGCVASLADKTCSEPHDSEILVLLGSRLTATPRAHSRQTSKSSLTLPDASRSPSKYAT